MKADVTEYPRGQESHGNLFSLAASEFLLEKLRLLGLWGREKRPGNDDS